MSAEAPVTERVRTSLELLYSVIREFAAQLEMQEVLQRVLQLTMEKVGAVSGSIMVLDENGALKTGAVGFEGKVLDSSIEKLMDPFEQGLAGWVVDNRKAAFVPSTLDDPRWLQRADDDFDETPRSAISVPIEARERVVGVLTMVHPQAERFTEDDLELLRAISDQAAIAVENARLFAAEQERQRFASTLQEIARSINSSLDPSQAFPQILGQLERVVDFDSASIFVVDDDTLRLVASRGFEDPEAALNVMLPLESSNLSGSVVTNGKTLVKEDVQREGGWLKREELPESNLIRGWIGAPLVVREKAVGVLSVDSHTKGAYGTAEAAIVSAFADHAATAVANAQLFDEIQRRVQANAALVETARVVTASLDLEEVLDRILRETMDGLNVEAASLALVDENSGDLEFRFAGGEVAENVQGLRLEKGKGVAGWVVEHGEPLMIADVDEDSRHYPHVDEQTGFETRMIAAAPIRVQDRTIGVLEAFNPARGEFSQEQFDLLEGIAFMAGTAISHARLFSETQAARLRYAGLFEDSVDPILITDLEGSISDANLRAESFLGYPQLEMLGGSILELHQPNEEVLPASLNELAAGDALAYESYAKHANGRHLPIEVHVKHIDIGQEPVLQWILRDISERLELDQLRSDLTSMIFHDLRAPLGNIISSLEVMNTSAPKGDEVFQSVLSIAQRSSRRASRLVESLLDLDRLEAGQAVLDKSPIPIGTLVSEAVEEVYPTAEAKGHLLRMQIEPEMPEIDVDVDMIRRVLINLLDNAIKYTRSGGKIDLNVQGKENHILVGVRDSGPGISEADQKHIFEKFSRIRRKTRPKGLGLGLAFCRLAVEEHGGRIWVESEEGKGATFYFTLPV
jgi:PAS domain S-box-containing protein